MTRGHFDALDRLITVTQKVYTGRVRGEQQVRSATFTAWAMRLAMHPGDFVETGESRRAAGLITQTVARWKVRQVAHADGRDWAIGDTFEADGLTWTVAGLEATRTPGGYVELYCEANSQVQ